MRGCGCACVRGCVPGCVRSCIYSCDVYCKLKQILTYKHFELTQHKLSVQTGRKNKYVSTEDVSGTTDECLRF